MAENEREPGGKLGSAGMPEGLVTSVKNPRVKEARRLHRGKERAETGQVLLDGRRLVETAVAEGVPLSCVFVLDPEDPLRDAAPFSLVVSPAVLSSLAVTLHPQGVVAVADWRPASRLDEILCLPSARVLVLDSVADPGNMGSLLRSAAAFDFDAAVLLRGSCDPTNPKCLRGAMGAIFSLPVVTKVSADYFLQQVRAQPGAAWTLVGASAADGVLPQKVEVGERLALVVGSEAKGLGLTLAEALDSTVKIPMAVGVDSLNTAAAGSILMWHFALG